MTVCICGRPVSSQFKFVTWRIKTSCQLLWIFVREILKVSPVFCLQIFNTNVKPVELQWVALYHKEITALIFIQILTPDKNL